MNPNYFASYHDPSSVGFVGDYDDNDDHQGGAGSGEERELFHGPGYSPPHGHVPYNSFIVEQAGSPLRSSSHHYHHHHSASAAAPLSPSYGHSVYSRSDAGGDSAYLPPRLSPVHVYGGFGDGGDGGSYYAPIHVAQRYGERGGHSLGLNLAATAAGEYPPALAAMPSHHHETPGGIAPWTNVVSSMQHMHPQQQLHTVPLSPMQDHNHHALHLHSIPIHVTQPPDHLEPGAFYASATDWMSQPLGGAAITGLAYDDTYAALYVASTAQPLFHNHHNSSNGGSGVGGVPASRTTSSSISHSNSASAASTTTLSSSSGAVGGGGGGVSCGTSRYNAAAMLAIHRIDPDNDMGALYASVPAHPEAPPGILTSLYQAIYGGVPSSTLVGASTTNIGGGNASARRHVPHHAYRPPYGLVDPGGGNVMMPFATLTPSPATTSATANKTAQMGITTLIATGSGYVASVSPAAVRLHAHGGLQVADRHVDGLVCGTCHPNSRHGSNTTHITVGGAALGLLDAFRQHGSSSHVICLDLWRGLEPVSYHSIHDKHASPTEAASIVITAMATYHVKDTIVLGGSDGQIRLLDGRLRGLAANVKCHLGGVVHVAVSDDGTLMATTGYSSKGTHSAGAGNSLYSFPDPNIFVYDMRYLGRGAFPHPFSGMNGGPRYLSFLPNVYGLPSNRLLVASGNPGGGLQVIVPFEEQNGSHGSTTATNSNNFIIPQLSRGESISTMCVYENDLVLATTQGRVIPYQMVEPETASLSYSDFGNRDSMATPFHPATLESSRGLTSLTSSPSKQRKERIPLVTPNYHPPAPALSLEPTLLQVDEHNNRIGINDKVKSIFTAYILTKDPVLSVLQPNRKDWNHSNAASPSSFGLLETEPLLSQNRLKVSAKLLSKASRAVEFMYTVPTNLLDINLMADHRVSPHARTGMSCFRENPNKLIYSNKLFALSYEESLNRAKRSGHRNGRDRRSDDDDHTEGGEGGNGLFPIPARYRLTVRPGHRSGSMFSHAEFNKTGCIPGWDYPPTMPNAFVPPVLMLLFSIPEIRHAALQAQAGDRNMASLKDRSLTPEIGLLFHRIESIARYGMLFGTSGSGSNDTRSTNTLCKIGVWAPNNFISCLSTMPEAEQLQILDGSPEAVDSPRRPEAFYRFLVHQMDKEISKDASTRVVDALCGISFTSINEFISGAGPPTTTSTRSLTVDMSYEPFLSRTQPSKKHPLFGDILQYCLCRETRLRAWCQTSKSYETIIQRKITTSLPSILSLSAACAGRKEDEGLCFWRGSGSTDDAADHWLPEFIDVELESTGHVVVKQQQLDPQTGEMRWMECAGTGSFLPPSISSIVTQVLTDHGPRRRRYRLDGVISMVRDDIDKNCPEEVRVMAGRDNSSSFGHHVLHVRVPKRYKRNVLSLQKQELQSFLTSQDNMDPNTINMTVLGLSADTKQLQNRLCLADERLNILDAEESTVQRAFNSDFPRHG